MIGMTNILDMAQQILQNRQTPQDYARENFSSLLTNPIVQKLVQTYLYDPKRHGIFPQSPIYPENRQLVDDRGQVTQQAIDLVMGMATPLKAVGRGYAVKPPPGSFVNNWRGISIDKLPESSTGGEIPKGGDVSLYHGSKTKFDTFDLTKTGTGEGGGKFGNGAYLTDNKDVADFYANVVAKKDYIEKYTDTGILGTPEPVFKPNADTLAKQNAKVNSFIGKNLNLLDAEKYKVDSDILDIFVQDKIRRGFSKEQATKMVNDTLNYAKTNASKIKDYRGELPYILDQNNANLGEKVATVIKSKGYDGIKYAVDKSYEGKGGANGFNYVIYNTKKLLSGDIGKGGVGGIVRSKLYDR